MHTVCPQYRVGNASDYYWGKCNQEGDQAACDTLNTIHVDYGDLSAGTHTVLGIASAIPIVGSVAATLDAGLYSYEGDYQDAALSALAAVPGGKIFGAGSKLVRDIRDVDEATTAGTKLRFIEDLGAGACSFSPDTALVTPAGRTAIASIRVGDSVEAHDPRTGETGPHTVTAVMVHTDPVIEHLATDTGPIETTPNHPFFTTDRGWIEAGSLTVGEQIRTESGTPASVSGFTLAATPATMWDLTVDGAHSFFVGSGAVLVHNACPFKVDNHNLQGILDTKLFKHFGQVFNKDGSLVIGDGTSMAAVAANYGHEVELTDALKGMSALLRDPSLTPADRAVIEYMEQAIYDAQDGIYPH